MNCALIKENPDGSLKVVYRGERFNISSTEIRGIESELEKKDPKGGDKKRRHLTHELVSFAAITTSKYYAESKK